MAKISRQAYELKKLKEGSIEDKVKKLYEEVRKETKTKTKETETDKPHTLTKPKSESKEKKKRRAKARGETVQEGPTVTIKELAFDFDITSKELRRTLRKNGFKKPGGRWEWPADGKEVKRIKKLLTPPSKRGDDENE